MQQTGDVFGETDFGVVDRLIADNFPGVGDTPELPGVVGDAVEDVEGDAVFVFYLRRLDRLAEELLHVALADVAGELADVAFWRLVLEEARVDLARHDYPDLDDLQFSSQAAAGVEEPQRLVGGLGPAVEAIRPRVVFGIYSVLEPRIKWVLVPRRAARPCRAPRDRHLPASNDRNGPPHPRPRTRAPASSLRPRADRRPRLP